MPDPVRMPQGRPRHRHVLCRPRRERAALRANPADGSGISFPPASICLPGPRSARRRHPWSRPACRLGCCRRPARHPPGSARPAANCAARRRWRRSRTDGRPGWRESGSVGVTGSGRIQGERGRAHRHSDRHRAQPGDRGVSRGPVDDAADDLVAAPDTKRLKPDVQRVAGRRQQQRRPSVVQDAELVFCHADGAATEDRAVGSPAKWPPTG